MITFPGIDEQPWTCIKSPLFKLGIIYENASGVKRLIISNDIPKFSSGMLKWVQNGISYLLNQDLQGASTRLNDDQRVRLGLLAQYVEERLMLRKIWRLMERCVGYRR